MHSFFTASPFRRVLFLAILLALPVSSWAQGEDPSDPPDIELPDLPDVNLPGFNGEVPSLELLVKAEGQISAFVFYLPPADTSGVWEMSEDMTNWSEVGDIVQTGGEIQVPAVQEFDVSNFGGNKLFVRFKLLTPP